MLVLLLKWALAGWHKTGPGGWPTWHDRQILPSPVPSPARIPRVLRVSFEDNPASQVFVVVVTGQRPLLLNTGRLAAGSELLLRLVA